MFSLIRQGSSLGISPRFKVKQTSNHEFGQIYLPTVNWMLMIGASILVVGFGSSDAMASAYGIAVTLTMLITTVLICLTMKEVWHWKPIYVFLFGLCFITIDLVFTVSNMMKIVDGGWVPLLIGSIAFMMMMTWSNGQDLLRQKLNSKSISKESLNNMSSCGQITRTCGTEIFLTKTDIGLPPLLCEFASKTHSIAQNAIIMNFHFSRFPFLHRKNNLKIQDLEDGFWRINVSYGYLQTPRVMAVLEEIRRMGVPVGNIHEATIIIGHETMVRKKENSEMNYFSAKLFSWMVKNSSKADQFFHIPKNQILEIGIQIEI